MGPAQALCEHAGGSRQRLGAAGIPLRSKETHLSRTDNKREEMEDTDTETPISPRDRQTDRVTVRRFLHRSPHED